MLILALECSTARGSMALAWGSGLENFRWHWRGEFTAGRGHGGELFTTLEKAMAEARQMGERLEEIVVGLGPGSYSGVRQAIAAATGLAFATGARLSGRPSTAALPGASLFHVVGDARRGTFYYTAVEKGVCLSGPELLPTLAALQTRMDEHPAWPVVAVETLPAGLPAETRVVFPQADCLLPGGITDFMQAPLEPIYLRPVTVTLPAGL